MSGLVFLASYKAFRYLVLPIVTKGNTSRKHYFNANKLAVNETCSQLRHNYSMLCYILYIGTIYGFFVLFGRENSSFNVLFLFVFVLKMALI